MVEEGQQHRVCIFMRSLLTFGLETREAHAGVLGERGRCAAHAVAGAAVGAPRGGGAYQGESYDKKERHFSFVTEKVPLGIK